MTLDVYGRPTSEYDSRAQNNECAASVIRSDYITRTEIVKLVDLNVALKRQLGMLYNLYQAGL